MQQAGHAGQKGKSSRYSILDGFRGFFLFNMMLVHMAVWMPAVLPRLNHHSFGYVEDAQGFVFLSGLVVALVYGRLLRREGVAALWPAIRHRAGVIYAHHAVLAVGVTLLALLVLRQSHGPAGLPPIFAPFATAPRSEGVLMLMLAGGPDFVDILPMYVPFILLAPLALVAIQRGHLAAVLAGSAGLWTAAQFGLVDQALDALGARTGLAAAGVDLGLYFNRLGWQLLFVAGLAVGMRLAEGRLDLSFLRHRRWRPVALIALAMVLLFGIVDLAHTWRLLPEPSLAFLDTETDRRRLSILCVLNFGADLFLIVWLLVAGAESSMAPVRRIAAGVGRFFTWRPLVFLGQHSLIVYTWHVAVVYAFYAAVDPGALPQAAHELIPLAGALSLFIPALLHARWRAWRRRPAAMRMLPALQPA